MYRRVGVRVLSRKLLDTRAYRFTLSRQSKNSPLQPLLKNCVAFALSSPLPNHLILPLPRLSLTPPPPLSSPPDKKQLNRSKILPSFLSFHQIVRSFVLLLYGCCYIASPKPFLPLVVSFLEIEIPAFAPRDGDPPTIYIYIRICFYRFRVRGRCISEFACVICVCVCVLVYDASTDYFYDMTCMCVCMCVYMCDRGPALRTNIASCILSSLFLFFHFFFLRKWQLSVTANGYINNHYTLRFNTIITILVNLRRRFYYSLR